MLSLAVQAQRNREVHKVESTVHTVKRYTWVQWDMVFMGHGELRMIVYLHIV